LGAICAAAMVWGVCQRPRAVRWSWRLSAAALAVLLVAVLACTDNAYTRRFSSYFKWDTAGEKDAAAVVGRIRQRLLATSRGRMIPAAVRAWRTAPVFGIGPGMHQNLWAHFAATPDGDRERGLWPEQLNNDFHSYEVHSDWVQLLEEYGVVGVILFLPPVVLVFFALRRGLTPAVRERCRDSIALPLGVLLACVAMAVHSVADFNLQIPSTTWLMGMLVALGLAAACGVPDTLPSEGHAVNSSEQRRSGRD